MTFEVPLSAVSLSALEACYVAEAVAQGAVSSSGPHMRQFEERLAQTIGVEHVVATASGTSALELVLRALEIGPGDEVVVPAFTFAAPALAVLLVGATPVFADVTADTWTIGSDQVRAVRTNRTRAVIAVDVLGHPCDYDGMSEIGLPIIEDAAQAFGAAYKGRSVGSFGVAAVFSFHANKTIACGEGGCVTTNDGRLACRLRRLNAFGMLENRRYWHVDVGCNHRMANLTAALGLGQVERYAELIAGRARVAAAYDRAVAQLPLRRRPVATWASESVWLYTLASPRRAEILSACLSRHIDARAIWPSLPENPALRRYAVTKCPIAKRVADTAFWLPTWSDMPDAMINKVISALRHSCTTLEIPETPPARLSTRLTDLAAPK
jgi:perosamine synthetase